LAVPFNFAIPFFLPVLFFMLVLFMGRCLTAGDLFWPLVLISLLPLFGRSFFISVPYFQPLPFFLLAVDFKGPLPFFGRCIISPVPFLAVPIFRPFFFWPLHVLAVPFFLRSPFLS
jgi:hypothetical protein